MILKTNFHFHVSDDPLDDIPYSAHDAINFAQKSGFDVLAFTCHQKWVGKKEYIDYAAQKGVLLISGIEAKIEKKDVIILNSGEKAEKIKSFKELKDFKEQNPQIFIIAPHPFVLSTHSLFSKLAKYIDIFDAIELSVFSNKYFDFNAKAAKIAEKYNKPLVATSDAHRLRDLKRGFSLIDSNEKSPQAIFEAIRKKKAENKLTPFNNWELFRFLTGNEVKKRKHPLV